MNAVPRTSEEVTTIGAAMGATTNSIKSLAALANAPASATAAVEAVTAFE